MKKSILTLTAVALLSSAVLTNCNTPAQKLENAENNVLKATKNLENAQEEYQADIESYKKETADRIEANNKSINAFNARIDNEKKEAKADYKKRIAELEQRNSDMKKKMDDYKAEGKEKGQTFKTEFSHDLYELGKAFNDLTVKNVK